MATFLGLALFSQFLPLFCSESARAFYNVMCGVVLYYIIVVHGKNWVSSLMDLMCVVALCNIAIAILQVFGIYLIWQGSTSVTGLMENPNSLSALLALCFPAFLRDSQGNQPIKYRGYWVATSVSLTIKNIISNISFIVRSVASWKMLSPLVLFGLFAAGSSGGMVAVMIGLSFYFLITEKERRLLFPIMSAGALVLFVLFFDRFPSLDTRMEAWTTAWRLFQDHWVVGCGLGRWKTEFIVLASAGQFPEGFIRLHSTLLQTMLEMGIGFAIILTGYIINIMRRSWGNLTQLAIPLTALIIILANGSVNFLIRIAPNAALVIVWLAIIEISLRKRDIDQIWYPMPEDIFYVRRDKRR